VKGERRTAESWTLGGRITLAALVLLGLASRSLSEDGSASLSAKDSQAVRDVQEAYRTAWLRGDQKGVLDTLTEDAVLLPAHGAKAVEGRKAITQYWWPPNAGATTITQLDITVDGMGGDCRVAYTHGQDNVYWETVENGAPRKHGHPGTYLNVLLKGPDGRWRIARHMWDDGPGQ